MHQTQFMQAMQTPCKLDGDIQHSLKRLPGAAFVKLSRINPLLETATLHILGKDQDLVTQGAEEPARHQVGVLGKVNPGLEFSQEIPPVGLFEALGAFDREPRGR